MDWILDDIKELLLILLGVIVLHWSYTGNFPSAFLVHTEGFGAEMSC